MKALLDLDAVGTRGGNAQVAWFCVRTRNKHEPVAAAHLRQDPEVEVFLPRVRYKRMTRLGPVWVVEALFQNYLFAKFDLERRLRYVQHARGVSGVVHFGKGWPIIAEPIIRELRQAMGKDDLREISDDLEVGEAVRIAGGPFKGLEAVVTRVMPGPQRIAVLLEFLGRQTTVELNREQVLARDMRFYPECLEYA